ncbi:Txe/YoeB family addiction module toxin [Sphingobacterium sp.]|uniref:Txe/YoeB family addiction module toxin n=1 Tax=Sphingobacterium sp. TaxID=341027 RepID=UPI0028A1952E|nr:Txe/YoeB family addiction module toxin [Sphingobacterium sp.]
MYDLIFTSSAISDIKFLKKTDKAAYRKVGKLLEELRIHPKSGTGKPKIKKHNLAGLYSRRITKKHRLVYLINDLEIFVHIISAKGHYGDK